MFKRLIRRILNHNNNHHSTRAIIPTSPSTTLEQYPHQHTDEQIITHKHNCLPSIGEIITSIGWVIATALCLWYIVDSSTQFNLSQQTPSTATSFIETIPLYFPAMTICNWNALLDDEITGQPCEYCNLTLKLTTRVNPVEGTVEEFELPHEQVQILQNGQLFNCYAFNNLTDSNLLLVANDTGYAGTLSFYFQVPNVPEEQDARFGLQISFHESGSQPEVFAETNFAISGVDNYFILTKIVTESLKRDKNGNINSDGSGSSSIVTRWDSSLSIIELTELDENLIVISVAYSSLNEHKIVEIMTNSIEGLLGQIAGIIGIFMGLDMLKMLRGCLEVPYAIKKKSVRGLWDNFN